MNLSIMRENCVNLDETIFHYIELKVHSSRFNLFEFIGEGIEGTVFALKNFAIKVSKNHILRDTSFLKILSDSPIFPKLYAYSEDFMVVEFVKGKTLGELGFESLEQLRFFPIEIKKKLLSAIEYCFSKFIIPNDLHLNNLMYCEATNEIKIIDVGKFTLCDKSYIQAAIESYKRDCKTYQNLIF